MLARFLPQSTQKVVRRVPQKRQLPDCFSAVFCSVLRIQRQVWFLALFVADGTALAQSQPFVVHDTKPVITHGPILIDPGETGVTVMWTTDTPSHSEVRYGAGTDLSKRAVSSQHGLIDIGTVHAVRITGLEPGKTYSYQIASTRVVKMKAYWPEKGLENAAPARTFTTLDRSKATAKFVSISDTHENVARIDSLMRAVDWPTTDFLVHTGDAFDWLDSEDQLFARWLDPIGKGLAQAKGLVFARGTHEMRGPFARELVRYLPIDGGKFYYARDHGPVHLLALDSGEDKPDSTNVYSRLNRSEPYLTEQLAWMVSHAKSDRRALGAPFRIVVVHQPEWGSMPNGREVWKQALNDAKVDLVIAGHRHRFLRTDAGADGRNYTTVVVGQGQFATVTATTAMVTVVVRSAAGAVVDSVSLGARR
jgi:predicted phosphodiesterase